MTEKLRQAATMALEALESTGENDGYAGVTQFYDGKLVSAAGEALREALAEPGWGGEWVTVPAKATLAMCEASGFDVSESRTAYARMIAAAPEPPTDHLRDATKMTLDEAIEHADEVAGCTGAQCGVEHAQLAAWLRELRDRRVAEMASHDHLRDATEMIGNEEAPVRKLLSTDEVDDLAFGYCPSGEIGELRELIRVVELRAHGIT